MVYLAAFQAAPALIFERHERVARTHRGVQSLFGALTAAEPVFNSALRSFLSRSCGLKTAADDETRPSVEATSALAEAAIEEARRLVAALQAALGADKPAEP